MITEHFKIKQHNRKRQYQDADAKQNMFRKLNTEITTKHFSHEKNSTAQRKAHKHTNRSQVWHCKHYVEYYLSFKLS